MVVIVTANFVMVIIGGGGHMVIPIISISLFSQLLFPFCVINVVIQTWKLLMSHYGRWSYHYVNNSLMNRWDVLITIHDSRFRYILRSHSLTHSNSLIRSLIRSLSLSLSLSDIRTHIHTWTRELRAETHTIYYILYCIQICQWPSVDL